jgi:hypothetical protein
MYPELCEKAWNMYHRNARKRTENARPFGTFRFSCPEKCTSKCTPSFNFCLFRLFKRLTGLLFSRLHTKKAAKAALPCVSLSFIVNYIPYGQLFKNSPFLWRYSRSRLLKCCIYPVLRKYPIFRRFFVTSAPKNCSNTRKM